MSHFVGEFYTTNMELLTHRHAVSEAAKRTAAMEAMETEEQQLSEQQQVTKYDLE